MQSGFSTSPATGVFSSSNALVRQVYLVTLRMTLTDKCSLWTGFGKRKELVSHSIQNFPPPVCQRKGALWRNTFFSSSASSFGSVLLLAARSFNFWKQTCAEPDSPPGTSRPANSGHLPPAWLFLPMVPLDDSEGQQETDFSLWEKNCPLHSQEDVLLQERKPQEAGHSPSRVCPRLESRPSWLLHSWLLPYSSWVYMPLTSSNWAGEDETTNSSWSFFLSKFGAKLVNSILGVEWDNIAEGLCLNRHHMDLCKGKQIILSCKNISGLPKGDRHPHVSVRWFCYKQLFLD